MRATGGLLRVLITASPILSISQLIVSLKITKGVSGCAYHTVRVGGEVLAQFAAIYSGITRRAPINLSFQYLLFISSIATLLL